ncbi:hypothetical protein PIB30_107559 [Stylosanthes scabra]|uniref:Uncharacterized protein n=1 Tax=Stylosanthes scabra TaxID=79078 RepID=A0ABU6TYP2_9FABA|nr:hypothetical protein [Stylosanthes scabra]
MGSKKCSIIEGLQLQPLRKYINPREECKAIRVIEMEEIPEVQVEVSTEKPEIIAEIKNQEDVQHPPQSSKKHTRSSPKFLEVLACLEVNIPLLKHLKDTPEYVKTMKEFFFKKKTVKKGNTVVLTKECSAII